MKDVSNVRMKSRIRQLMILLTAILMGIIISSALRAEDFNKANARHYKRKYKTQIRLAGKECIILNKKRNEHPKSPLFAFHKLKYKPLPEVNDPGIRKNESAVATAP